MQKMAQDWFSGGSSEDLQPKPSSSSLLADWNSYAASRDDGDSSGLGIGFDLDSAVRSANETVTGTFSVVSKGVRDIPGNLQSATSNIPSGKSLMYFGLFLDAGVFFVFIAFALFLPVIVLMPQKFAICFTLGCIFIISSFVALKGPMNQFDHMTSKERLPFTLGFIGSMVGTIYVSMVLHSYVLSVLFSLIQVLSLAYYAISYFPGGSAGMKFLSASLISSITRCFGRLKTDMARPTHGKGKQLMHLENYYRELEINVDEDSGPRHPRSRVVSASAVGRGLRRRWLHASPWPRISGISKASRWMSGRVPDRVIPGPGLYPHLRGGRGQMRRWVHASSGPMIYGRSKASKWMSGRVPDRVIPGPGLYPHLRGGRGQMHRWLHARTDPGPDPRISGRSETSRWISGMFPDCGRRMYGRI